MGLFSIFQRKKSFKDPICGMVVDPKTAVGSEEHEGRTFYFCSVNCMGKFRADPHQYGH